MRRMMMPWSSAYVYRWPFERGRQRQGSNKRNELGGSRTTRSGAKTEPASPSCPSPIHWGGPHNLLCGSRSDKMSARPFPHRNVFSLNASCGLRPRRQQVVGATRACFCFLATRSRPPLAGLNHVPIMGPAIAIHISPSISCIILSWGWPVLKCWMKHSP